MGSKIVVAGVLGALLMAANCGRLDQLQEAREFADLAVDANRVRTRVIGDSVLGREGLSGTAFDAVPRSGRAVFKGVVILAAIDPTDENVGFALVGRSDVTVDFGSGRNNVRGTLDEFQSSREGDGILDVSGVVQLQNGVVGAVLQNEFTVDYSGNVTVEGDRYTVSGDLDGRFRGTRTDPNAGQSTVRAIAALDVNGSVRGNGERLVGRMTIMAEN
ncbi:MAG: hypothetical protein ACI9ND_000348 [Yoonia sp.]|jgi:hypothetical protein